MEALAERWEAREKRSDLRAAAVACTVANLFIDKKEHPRGIRPEDIFASLRPKPRRAKPATSEQMMEMIELANAAMDGKRLKDQG